MYSALIDGYCKEGSALARTLHGLTQEKTYGAYENI